MFGKYFQLLIHGMEIMLFQQLARRVREMRETKAVPVIQKIERKASAMGLKVLNNLQSFPRGMECIDPLGLG